MKNPAPKHGSGSRRVSPPKSKPKKPSQQQLKSSKAKRPQTSPESLQGSAVHLPDIEPWPEPVDGAVVLNEIAERHRSYVAMHDYQADVCALWEAHAHVFRSFQCSPRLNITSATRGCAKTTLRDVVALSVPRPLPTENLTMAVLFRLVQCHSPTILADECDTWLRNNEELLGLLNAGHRRGGTVYRCVGDRVVFQGVVSFDGASNPVAGQRQSRSTSRLGAMVRSPNGKFQIQISGRRWASWIIQASSNLEEWVPLKTSLTGDGRNLEFEDPLHGGLMTRFYRAAEQ